MGGPGQQGQVAGGSNTFSSSGFEISARDRKCAAATRHPRGAGGGTGTARPVGMGRLRAATGAATSEGTRVAQGVTPITGVGNELGSGIARR